MSRTYLVVCAPKNDMSGRIDFDLAVLARRRILTNNNKRRRVGHGNSLLQAQARKTTNKARAKRLPAHWNVAAAKSVRTWANPPVNSSPPHRLFWTSALHRTQWWGSWRSRSIAWQHKAHKSPKNFKGDTQILTSSHLMNLAPWIRKSVTSGGRSLSNTSSPLAMVSQDRRRSGSEDSAAIVAPQMIGAEQDRITPDIKSFNPYHCPNRFYGALRVPLAPPPLVGQRCYETRIFWAVRVLCGVLAFSCIVISHKTKANLDSIPQALVYFHKRLATGSIER